MLQPVGLQGSSRSDLKDEFDSFKHGVVAKVHVLPPEVHAVPVGCPEDPLGETGQSLRLLLVPLQVLAQQGRERAKRLLLEHEPLRLEQTLGDGRLELTTGAQLTLQRKNERS